MALLSPLQNKILSSGKQKLWKITQEFGGDEDRYSQFGLRGHNGIDFDLNVGTAIFAPMDGISLVRNNHGEGFGLYIKIRNEFKRSECVLAHLSRVVVRSGQRINMGDLIGYGGNSGYSTGPHLHLGYRQLLSTTKETNIFRWRVKNYRNGYAGYLDVLDYLICWRGGYLRKTF